MVQFYLKLVKNQKINFTIDDVPEKYREAVRKLL